MLFNLEINLFDNDSLSWQLCKCEIHPSRFEAAAKDLKETLDLQLFPPFLFFFLYIFL